jgi:hypothetical protein
VEFIPASIKHLHGATFGWNLFQRAFVSADTYFSNHLLRQALNSAGISFGKHYFGEQLFLRTKVIQ